MTSSRQVENPIPTRKAPRSSNLELYRILLMLLIVAHHYVVCSGLTDPSGKLYADMTNWRSLFLVGVGGWGKIGINCFVLITGYFMCKSEITLKKFLKLFGEVLFYRWTIFAIFFASGRLAATPRNLLTAVLPATQISANFVSCFLVFFLFIPFLNALIRNLDEKKHLLLVGLTVFVFSLAPSVPIFKVESNYVFWFCVLYFVASYLRLYPKKIFDSTSFCGAAALALVCVCLISTVGGGYATGKYLHHAMPFYFVVDCNKFLALITSVALFLFFKNVRVPQSRVVNTIASSTFAVLLIHAHSEPMRVWLWKDALQVTSQFDSNDFLLRFFGSVFAVYFGCVIIDQARIALLERPFFRWYDRHEESISRGFSRMGTKIWRLLNVKD